MKGEPKINYSLMLSSNVVCEFIEIAIHCILHLRRLYPETVFERKRKYGVVVYQSIHPGINEYISQCIKAINYHLRKFQLKNVYLCFHFSNKIIEKYNFEIVEIGEILEDSDHFLVKFEQYLSEFYIKLHHSPICLKDLPNDSSFSIQLQVTEYSRLEYNQDSSNEDFPWINCSTEKNSISSEIIPLHTVETEFLNLQIRKRKNRHDSPMDTTRTVKAIFKKDDLDDSMSASDWDLVIDDNYKRRRRDRSVKLDEEPLSLTCKWDACFKDFTEYIPFNDHLKDHLEIYGSVENDGAIRCYWLDCSYIAMSMRDLNQHVCYHGYHTKLKSIGKNVEFRAKLPECTQSEHFVIPMVPDGYHCEWEYCSDTFDTIYDFFQHIRVHIYHNPKGCKEGVITCCWKGCTYTGKFISQYKLSEHLRIHTKEKIIACPTCGNLFANKTKFCDHRKRQLPLNCKLKKKKCKSISEVDSGPIQSYLCSQCSKYFPSERLLRDHMRLHINHYKCSMCEMTCPKPSILAKHIRYKHLNEKPYKCDKCEYRCVSKHNLVFHLRKHNPDSQFKCTDCSYECRSAFGMDKHYHKVHGNGWNNVYECHNCKKRFSRGGLLTKHLMKAHNYHWPSGHSRFRYKVDQDGIFRLQTVRYETLDVTEEIIKGKTVQAPSEKEPLKFDVLKRESNNDGSVHAFDIVLSKEPKKKSQPDSRKKVVITIDDIDSKGNVLKSQTIQSSEIICEDIKEMPSTLQSDIVLVDGKKKPKRRKARRTKSRKKK